MCLPTLRLTFSDLTIFFVVFFLLYFSIMNFKSRSLLQLNICVNKSNVEINLKDANKERLLTDIFYTNSFVSGFLTERCLKE